MNIQEYRPMIVISLICLSYYAFWVIVYNITGFLKGKIKMKMNLKKAIKQNNIWCKKCGVEANSIHHKKMARFVKYVHSELEIEKEEIK